MSCKPTTSETVKDSEIYSFTIPSSFSYEKYINPEMCPGKFGCLVYKFKPIGWSADGKFAYITEPENEAYGGYNFNLFIQNMITDSIEWSWSFEEGEQENWDERIRDSIESIVNVNENLFAKTLQKFKIIPIDIEKQFIQFPYEKENLEYQVSINQKKEPMDGFNSSEIKSEAVLISAEGLGTKTVFTKNYKEYNWMLNSSIIGAIPSPHENRLALIKVNERRGWEGPPNVLSIELVGCHLEKGFKIQ